MAKQLEIVTSEVVDYLLAGKGPLYVVNGGNILAKYDYLGREIIEITDFKSDTSGNVTVQDLQNQYWDPHDKIVTQAGMVEFLDYLDSTDNEVKGK